MGNIGIEFFVAMNTSAYNDQQSNVVVEYVVHIYDDRGNLVVDSEDPNKDDSIQEIEKGCDTFIIFGMFSLCGIVTLLGSIKRLRS